VASSFGFDFDSLPYDFATMMWIVDMHGKQLKDQVSYLLKDTATSRLVTVSKILQSRFDGEDRTTQQSLP